MCAMCTAESLKASAATGGMGALQPVLAASLTALGAKSLGGWVGSRHSVWLTGRRVDLVCLLLATTILAAWVLTR